MRYYHNFYTLNGARHFYNSNIPRFVQIEDHAFVEVELCELFTSYMLLAWVSQQNCANIHNASIKRSSLRSSRRATQEPSLSSEQVFRAFSLNALLRESAEEGAALVLPDLGDNHDRLKVAMEIRNKKMIHKGQKERMHACSRCEKPLEGDGYNGLSGSIFIFIATNSLFMVLN
jgi:hypothetical protein